MVPWVGVKSENHELEDPRVLRAIIRNLTKKVKTCTISKVEKFV